MICVYDKDATDFTGLGLGALDPSRCIVREDAGGLYELELDQPITADGRHLLLELYGVIKAPAPVREAPVESYATVEDSSVTITREIYKIITIKRLSLRSEPNDTTSYNLKYYDPGTLVIKLDDLGITANYHWFKVQMVDGGEVGYMAFKAEFDGVWYDYLEYQRSETETIQGDTPGSVVMPMQARDQLFRIYSITRNVGADSVTVLAQHITYDLKGVVCTGTYTPENVSAKTVVTEILSRADHQHKFTIYCGITQEISGDYSGRNLIDIICDSEDGILVQTGGRLIRDNFTIYLIEDQVRDLGVRIWRGKNLLQAAMETDCANVITKIIPQGTDKDGNPLVGDPVLSEHINDYPVVYTKQIVYDVHESDDMSRADALAALQDAAEADFADGVDLATVNINADFVRMELVPEFMDIATNSALHLYDTAGICAPDQQVVATLRMTAYEYDSLRERYASTELGRVEDVEPTVYGYEIGGSISGTKITINSIPGTSIRTGSIKAAAIDAVSIFASEATIEQLNAYDIRGNDYLDLYVPAQLDTGDSGVKVHIDSESFSVDVPGTNGDLRLDSDGGKLQKAVIDTLICPGVAMAYNGSSAITVGKTTSTYLSLTEAIAAVSNRVMAKDVTITLEADLYERIELTGTGGAGSLTIDGDGHTLSGCVKIANCSNTVTIMDAAIVSDGSNTKAVQIVACQYVALNGCSIDGNSGTDALYVIGSKASLSGVGLYNATNLLYVNSTAHIAAYNLEGDGGTYFLVNDGGIVQMAGTRPDGAYSAGNAPICVPADPSTLTVDAGSVTPVTPSTTTATLACTASGTYSGSWSSGNTIVQGRYDTELDAGCMWFDTTAISGKTIRSATITIKRLAGWGTWQATPLHLCGTTATGKSGNPTTGYTSYGSIGSLTEGSTGTFAVPTAAVQALASGTIKGLMLYITPDSGGGTYSANYSAYAGYGASGAPVLTVTYDA